MNTADLRDMEGTQNRFWCIAGPLSFLVIMTAMTFAFRIELGRLLLRGSRSAVVDEVELGFRGFKQD